MIWRGDGIRPTGEWTRAEDEDTGVGGGMISEGLGNGF